MGRVMRGPSRPIPRRRRHTATLAALRQDLTLRAATSHATPRVQTATRGLITGTRPATMSSQCAPYRGAFGSGTEMSDTSEAPAAAPSSAIGFGTIFRLLAIALGIMSAVLLARDGFNISLNNYLDAVVQAYDDAIKEVALLFLEPFILVALAKLREWFDWHLQLYPHWKHAFVLLWLFFGAIARSLMSMRYWAQTLFTFLWGMFCSVAGGVLAGTQPLSEPGTFWWPASFYCVYMTGNFAWSATFARTEGWTWLESFGLFGMPKLAVAAACAMAAGLAVSDPAVFWWPFAAWYLYLNARAALAGQFSWGWAIGATVFVALAVSGISFGSSSSPGVATLAAVVGIIAALSAIEALEKTQQDSSDWDVVDEFLSGSTSTASSWDRWLRDDRTRVGLDVLSVLGGAAFIVWLGNALA